MTPTIFFELLAFMFAILVLCYHGWRSRTVHEVVVILALWLLASIWSPLAAIFSH